MTTTPAPNVTAVFTRSLQAGSSGSDVKALQIFLNQHGFIIALSGPGSPGHETDFFGAMTQIALTHFQVSKGILPERGYLGPLTKKSLELAGPVVSPLPSTTPVAAPMNMPNFSRNLVLGAAGSDVRSLQQFLNTHGFTVVRSGPGSPGNETNYFGAATKSALVSFQKKYQITPAEGYFGPKTKAKISELLRGN